MYHPFYFQGGFLEKYIEMSLCHLQSCSTALIRIKTFIVCHVCFPRAMASPSPGAPLPSPARLPLVPAVLSGCFLVHTVLFLDGPFPAAFG